MANLPKGIRRRGSGDDYYRPQKFLVHVDSTLKRLLENEDTDNNFQITVEDSGPKVLDLGTANSNGFRRYNIQGTYMLSNLLQELTLAKRYGRKTILLDEDRLNENPVARLQRLIKKEFWKSLTRCIDSEKIDTIALDPKNRSKDPRPRIYVPHSLDEQYDYYTAIAAKKPHLQLQVERLPEKITPDFVKSINEKPGLLALAMQKKIDPLTGKQVFRGEPYVVPGGRFNEFYGWDSYMIALGLIVDGRVDLAKAHVTNFCFEIKHYGKILNANRSYYLNRSQPPFLSDLALRVFDEIKNTDEHALSFLETAIRYAIKEYQTVWCSKPRLDTETGLSRYRPEGKGIPPETEPSHFVHLLTPYAKKHSISLEDFQEKYNDGEIQEPELDEYFLHDRAVRESGHDTTYRFEGTCADLATVDLNALLYKYELDISYAIKTYFDDDFVGEDGLHYTSSFWDDLSSKRKSAVDKYLWNEEKGMYFDYNTKSKQMIEYESVTTFWPMWSGLASKDQAESLVNKNLSKFEMFGGLVSGTERSKGSSSLNRPNRQWDYPTGWAPHQILAWEGLRKYGYLAERERVCYRWMYLITQSFVSYNGVVVEKYDVTSRTEPHKVSAEYGNQGLAFKGVATEGFGWVNASYSLGLTILSEKAKRILGALTDPEGYIRATSGHVVQEEDETSDREA